MHHLRIAQGRGGSWAMSLPQANCGLSGEGLQGVTGWSKPISLGQHRFRIGCVGGMFNIDKTVPICRQNWSGADKGAIAAVLPALAPCYKLSLSAYVSCTSRAADPPLKPRVSVCEQVSLCVSLRGMSGLLGSFGLIWMFRILTDFYILLHFVGTLLQGTGILGWGAPV